MANTGVNTNGSQFFITLQPAEWLDKKNVAFGQLVEGFNILGEIEMQGNWSRHL
jgi:cyclophilin family peptidyl-prolyl cis-trans isomerase